MEKNTVTLGTALDVFQDNLEEIKGACIENMRDILIKEGKVRNWIHEDVIKLRIAPLQKVLKRIIGRQQELLRPRATSITNDMIARAKERPIEEMYDGVLVHNSGLCPFHAEKTPSFYIKNNRFNCFGCNKYGDAIDFYRLIHNTDFIQAVRALQQ